MPQEGKIPNRLVATGVPVVISDLGITIGKEEVNLKTKFNDRQIKRSVMLKRAYETGLLKAAPKPVVSAEELL